MDPTILVAYATRGGSTAALAYAMAETLRDLNLCQEVWPARQVPSLHGFDGVVVVAALYIGRLHRDARRFLKRYRKDLEQLPVALLVPGPVRNDPKDFDAARRQLGKELARLPWLNPVATHVVGGVWDPAKLGFPFNLIPAARHMEASDARDWDQIRATARTVAEELQTALTAKA